MFSKMTSMKKYRIALVSILKPVNDVRMYEKIAKSWAGNRDVEVFLMGRDTAELYDKIPSFNWFPHLIPSRSHWKRIWTYVVLYQRLLKVKPDLIVFNHIDNHIIILIIRILFGTILLYDIQENAIYNIKYINTYPPLFRRVIVDFIRLLEWITRKASDGMLLAEKCYVHEFGLDDLDPWIIMENKALAGIIPQVNASELLKSWVFTGTIAPSNGPEEAIELISHQNLGKLFLIGSFPTPQYAVNLRSKALSLKVDLQTFNHSVFYNHTQLMQLMHNAEGVLAPYRLHRGVYFRNPTKVYEAVSIQKKLILSGSLYWRWLMINLGYNKEQTIFLGKRSYLKLAKERDIDGCLALLGKEQMALNVLVKILVNNEYIILK
jgi:hypothetical protein